MGPDTETMIRHASVRHARLQLSELGRLWLFLSFFLSLSLSLSLWLSRFPGSFSFSSISPYGSLSWQFTRNFWLPLEVTAQRFDIFFERGESSDLVLDRPRNSRYREFVRTKRRDARNAYTSHSLPEKTATPPREHFLTDTVRGSRNDNTWPPRLARNSRTRTASRGAHARASCRCIALRRIGF